MTETEKRTGVLSGNVLKYIAAVCMLTGHTYEHLSHYSLLNSPVWEAFISLISLVAPPVFFFFIAEGFRYTKSPGKYALRLLLLAVITQIPSMLARYGTISFTAETFYLNVIFDLLLGLLSLMLWESSAKPPLKAAGLAAIIAAAHFLNPEWSVFGVIIIFAFHVFRDKPVVRTIIFLITIFMSLFGKPLLFGNFQMFIKYFTVKQMRTYNLISMFYCIIGYLLTVVLYNGQRGKNTLFSKYFFYVFFPAHWILIFILTKLL